MYMHVSGTVVYRANQLATNKVRWLWIFIKYDGPFNFDNVDSQMLSSNLLFNVKYQHWIKHSTLRLLSVQTNMSEGFNILFDRCIDGDLI